MTALYELKAAVLASIENTGIPVMCSMSFEENGRTFTGCSVEAFAATIEGLGVEAAGINCSLGPDEIYPLAKKLCEVTNLPVFAKPNAGLPDPATGEYDITAADFTVMIAKYAELGVSAIGGCCSTYPGFIADLSKMLDGDMDYIAKQAIIQEDEGAEVLDVNVSVPGIDEVKVLPAIVKHVQSVTDLPLQIDCSNAEAVEAAFRVYNGKAIVNSVNGEETSRRAILPIVRKYSAAVIGLTLDEEGIPETAEKRVEIAEKIQRSCREIGILDNNIVIDCLTLTVSVQPEGAKQTLEAMRRVKKELGLKTVLGVSNISFGLPHRPVINSTFLTMAIGCGLDIVIIDPGNVPVMDALHTACVLMNIDKNAEKYIARFGNRKEPAKTAVHGSTCAQGEEISVGTAESGAAGSGDSDKNSIYYCLEKALGSDARKLISAMLETKDEMSILNEDLIPALDRIGKNFEAGRLFLPQMMQTAGAVQERFEVIKANFLEKGEQKISRGRIVIATVKGDIHDVGKNIVKVIMDNYGFEMIDLGKDVDPEAVVEAAIENDVRLVGLSALMTTTLGSMEETIKQLHRAKPDCKVMVGDAVLTAEYAEKIGADYYSKDAMQAVEAAKDALKDADV